MVRLAAKLTSNSAECVGLCSGSSCGGQVPKRLRHQPPCTELHQHKDSRQPSLLKVGDTRMRVTKSGYVLQDSDSLTVLPDIHLFHRP